VLAPDAVRAQDLFELEVFDAETTPRGEFDAEFHVNGLSSGSVASSSVSGNHRPVHISVEVARGWTERVDTAVFVQTAPFGPDGSARFAGGHVRGRLRLAELTSIPLRFAISGEYAFNRAAFDPELQTLEIRPIVQFTQGRLTLIANPSIEVVTHSAEEGPDPVFDVSARGAWNLTRSVALTTDYFSAVATTRHLQPEPSAHHLLFGGVELAVGDGWEVGLSLGHCVTRSEPWVVKTQVGFRF
jgi:hypothetical protein